MMCECVYMMQREAIVNRLNITHSEIKGSRRRLARVESCYFRFPIHNSLVPRLDFLKRQKTERNKSRPGGRVSGERGGGGGANLPRSQGQDSFCPCL